RRDCKKAKAGMEPASHSRAGNHARANGVSDGKTRKTAKPALQERKAFSSMASGRYPQLRSRQQ
ncbi:MAG: hypothetical protein WAT25_08040, partial [Paracoccaceae bacterium]